MKRLSAEIVTLLICLSIGFIGGVIGGDFFTVKRLKRESLEGYKAKATYITNNIGEITIDKIKWEK